MNISAVTHVVSISLILLGLLTATAVPVGYVMGDTDYQMIAFAICATISVFVGIIFAYITHKKDRHYGVREGFGIVGFTWLVLSIFGALPFIFVQDFTWYDAFFETVSGLTTTGASVIDSTLIMTHGETLEKGIESVCYSLLYWRAMTHWIGGMGVVILSVAILPFLGLGTQNLFKAESTGPTSSQLTPRITSVAKLLWGFYFLMTLVLAVLLRSADMNWFDAWCHACSTIATGGFANKQASIAFYNSHAINWILSFFMLYSGINFILHLKALRGQPLLYFKDEEVRWYLSITALCIGILTICAYFSGDVLITVAGKEIPNTIFNAVEHATFTVCSIITTTGFATIEYTRWGTLACIMLLFIMVIGGCGGSTSGGLKQSRLIILLKYAIDQVKHCLFPHAISDVRINKTRLDLSTVYKTLGFFVIYAMILFISTVLLIIICETTKPMDIQTSLSASISALSNIGPALGALSPSYTHSDLPPLAKILLSIVMIMGRLEFFTILVLLLPGFWRK